MSDSNEVLQAIAKMSQEVNGRFDTQQQHITAIEQRLLDESNSRLMQASIDQLNTRLGDLTYRVGSMEQQMALVHADLANINQRLDRVESRFQRVDGRLDLADEPTR